MYDIHILSLYIKFNIHVYEDQELWVGGGDRGWEIQSTQKQTTQVVYI